MSEYMHHGGRKGRDRLAVLSRVLTPATTQLFDRIGPREGWTVIDAGCGGGDVAFDLARRVGPKGRVFGLDVDETQLSIVRTEADQRGVENLKLQAADVRAPWPVPSADMVYARFILTHLPEPSSALERAFGALKPGGLLVVEDVDMAGHFCHPPCPAFDRYYQYYLQAAKLRRGDPFIGLGLDLLFENTGFANVETMLVQAFGRRGDVKLIPELTMEAMGEGLRAAGLATQLEVDQTVAELKAFCEKPDTLVFMPRVFQVCGTRP